jgi:hypothetical protein
MKVSQLKEIIRTKVRESLTVKTGGKILTPQQQSQQIDQIKRTTGDQTAGSINNPVNFVKESGTGDPNIEQMSRAEMINWLGMTPREGLPWTNGELRNAMYDMTQDIEQEPADGIDEADYFDVDDNTIIEDDEFSDYDNIYERMKKIVTYKG